MAFGANSKVFVAFIESVLEASTTPAMDVDGDSYKCALWNDTIGTPDETVAASACAYNTGVWLAAGGYEEEDTTEWDAAGEPLTTVTSGVSTNVYSFDAANTQSGGSSATLADVRGCLIYDDTITSQNDHGVCFNSFGGGNSVTNGTFTVVYGAAIFQITV